MAARRMKTKLGMPGIRPMIPRMEAVIHMTRGLANIWPRNWLLMSSSSPTRVTTMPAAMEMISAGIWATRPSPIVSRV